MKYTFNKPANIILLFVLLFLAACNKTTKVTPKQEIEIETDIHIVIDEYEKKGCTLGPKIIVPIENAEYSLRPNQKLDWNVNIIQH